MAVFSPEISHKS